ncbi:hypothetical protein [Antarcticimicrobium luteum]|uniref:Uncharacterized protein n=1 Tax=Antarcticimicrobium luteum TaxID=2547397 RepID=A0A4R5UWZ2_9RHOB|nr:hypothetical protein [Antarcticimicrobium luteum]TDK43834.1 hypothetical protein E1832_16280 [Antarcticimicrobium luteum]
MVYLDQSLPVRAVVQMGGKGGIVIPSRPKPERAQDPYKKNQGLRDIRELRGMPLKPCIEVGAHVGPLNLDARFADIRDEIIRKLVQNLREFTGFIFPGALIRQSPKARSNGRLRICLHLAKNPIEAVAMPVEVRPKTA